MLTIRSLKNTSFPLTKRPCSTDQMIKEAIESVKYSVIKEPGAYYWAPERPNSK